jgi:hypothetical protein
MVLVKDAAPAGGGGSPAKRIAPAAAQPPQTEAAVFRGAAASRPGLSAMTHGLGRFARQFRAVKKCAEAPCPVPYLCQNCSFWVRDLNKASINAEACSPGL